MCLENEVVNEQAGVCLDIFLPVNRQSVWTYRVCGVYRPRQAKIVG
jgi:hypothetical protein